MKLNLKKSLFIFGATSVLIMAFAGSVGGSLAWWAYSTRSAVSYQGTSVTTSVRLQIGLKTTDFDSTQASALEGVGLTEDEDLRYTSGGHTYRYFFTNAGSGLTTNAIATYLTAEDIYAVDMLYPVTSGAYETGNDIELKNSIMAGTQYNSDPAPKDKYVYIPFVFRIANYNGSSYYSGESIWLTDVMAEKDAGSTIENQWIEDALRVYFDNGTDKLIVKPSDDYEGVENRQTATYGPLDLNNDGYYDAIGSNEVIYGQRTINDALVESSGNITVPDYSLIVDPEDIPFSNINGVEDTSEATTFYARHPEGVNCYQYIDSAHGITGTYANYKTLAQIAPNKTPEGVYSGGTPLVTTEDHEVIVDVEGTPTVVNKPMGELDMYIWLEGWDHATVDSQIGGVFNLGLQFEINLLG